MNESITATPAVTEEKFVRGLGLLDSTMLVAGSMIGSGIFIVSAIIARQVGAPGWLLVVWIVTGLLTLMASLSYGELAAMMPKAGGQYVYLREAFSPGACVAEVARRHDVSRGLIYLWRRTALRKVREAFVPAVIEGAMRAATVTDCLLCVGTSLQVYPVAGAVPTAKANGARIVIVNAQETAFDEVADVKLTDHISEVLPQLCAAS